MSSLKGSDTAPPALDRIWTVGHSTRSAGDFIDILKKHLIRRLVDVRSFPGSRRYPQFNKPELAGALESEGIAYLHLPELGGRRKPMPNSKNTAWQNASFRAYADYMESEEFQKGIEVLLREGKQKQTAVMCAEALWWRCHRSLISDYLKAQGVEVVHIIDASHREVHPYTTAARIIEGQLSYAGLLDG